MLINHGALESNSAYHVLGHAAALAAAGHDVCAGMVKGVSDGGFERLGGYRIGTHRTLLRQGAGFSNGAGADVLHVWTPREHVRQFAVAYRERHGAGVLVIHLEDHEQEIFERFTGHAWASASGAAGAWPKGLICPHEGAGFLAQAAGFTVVHKCLELQVPAGARWQELVPVLDTGFFTPPDGASALRQALGIPATASVIGFHGNDHPAVAADIRSLYEAVQILIDRGRDVVLLRTGQVMEGGRDDLPFRRGERCIELGFVDRSRIPGLIGLSSVVIQPGNADAFNAHRLPAKIPEYLLMGKPLIMGRANIAGELAAAGAALILPEVNARTLAGAVDRLLTHPADTAAMAERGRRFAVERFNREPVTAALLAFYLVCLRSQRA